MKEEQPTQQKSPGSADDRSTTFQPVQGGPEMKSGEKLVVQAYAAIWIVLVVFVASLFRRQRQIDRQIATLENALAQARKKSE